ncbi:hypothetical protein SEA_RACHALY_64 [Mycobacterium Phage Rachaly]|nr:hypothetical protein SEA_RACHALY_64 [Mycobacterium Phage Rachaly]QGH78756.1 hypothetical protein SEA_MIKO_62 [Mycobacterium phage Miko]
MKKTIAAALIGLAAVLGLTACDPHDAPASNDTYPHGFIYVPPVGKSPGVGPIFY